MEFPHFFRETKISSPEDEKRFLQEVALERGQKEGITKDQSVERTLREYAQVPSKDVLHSHFEITPEHIRGLVENLSPEAHDKNIEYLIGLIEEKGIKNALLVIEAKGDTHLEDDLHRFLVQYVRQGLPVKGLKERTPLSKALQMTLFEVVLPESVGAERPIREVISSMEQFYAGMLSISSPKHPREHHLALEIANSNGSEEFVFYVSVPNEKRELFQKHILSVFPLARILEKHDDHNVFATDGVSMISIGQSGRNPIFPIRTYESFDRDPLNAVLNSFAKLERDDEGACLQVLMAPAGEFYTAKFQSAIKKLESGIPTKEAIDIPLSAGAEVKQLLGTLFSSSKKKVENNTPPSLDTDAINRVKEKISHPIVSVGIRIVASAKTKERAESILSDLESGFRQFDNPQGNAFRFKREKGNGEKVALRHFAFRAFRDEDAIPLNLKELTSIMHFHTEGVKEVTQLKTTSVGSASAPLEISHEGILLGVNEHRGLKTNIYMTDEDRLRHVYAIGQTGTGKSTLLKNMIIQDIERGEGVCMIDPHGSDVLDVLSQVPPHRAKDVIYFDPSNTEYPMALNMLEYDARFPEQKTFVVNEIFNIFQKLYGAVPESMGPMFEQYFRNATMLVIEDPESGSTLLDVSRVLSNKQYREQKLSKCKNPIVLQFWTEIASKAGGEASLQNIVPYITSKFDVFLANDIMRPIIAQEKSSFSIRDIMDSKKILLVNLSKGRLGDINANLIGLILVGKILMSALSRVDSIGQSLPPFYLYIDEFQNITTNSIATILSEARKYKLSLTIAHQFIGQLEESIKNAVFGNVGTLACFRVGTDDAEYLVKQFDPVFTVSNIINIPNRNAYMRMLVHGKPVRPFNIETLPPKDHNAYSLKKEIIEASQRMYGRARGEVEAEIMKKYHSFTAL